MDSTKQTIMVIEDEELLLKAITKKLELNGINVKAYTNGRQALENLREMKSLPDAIWLDYYLRDMNGLDFMHELKRDGQLSTIPVVVVSNSANSEKVHNILALGAKKYLLKAEYRLDDIIAAIREFMTEKHVNTT